MVRSTYVRPVEPQIVYIEVKVEPPPPWWRRLWLRISQKIF